MIAWPPHDVIDRAAARIGRHGVSPPIAPTFADIEDAARQIAGVAHRTPVVDLAHAGRRSPTRTSSSSARIFSAAAPSSSAAPTTRCLASRQTSGDAACSPSRQATMPRRSRSPDASSTSRASSSCRPTRPASNAAPPRPTAARSIAYDRQTGDRESIGRRIAAERGLTVIPPYDHADIIAGQGTAARELLRGRRPARLPVRAVRRRRAAVR